MNYTITTLEVNHLGYAAIFFCISVGFSLLKLVSKTEHGPGFWALSFFMNAMGFVCWSGLLPLPRLVYYLIGEIFHMSGFLFLVVGVYRFCAYRFRPIHLFILIGFLVLWALALSLFSYNRNLSSLALRVLRSGLFIVSGIHVLRKLPREHFPGKRLVAVSLLLWAVYIVSYGFLHVKPLHDFLFGILVGFQILAGFGFIALVIDRVHVRAKESEARVAQLEKLLPVCSHCKKIRDNNDRWHEIEDYVEKISASRLSHGICPQCSKEHFGDYANKI